MKQKRLLVPEYTEGREVGGLIVGSWKTNDPDHKDWAKFEVYQDGLIQLGSRSKVPNAFIPENWLWAIIRCFPKLLPLSLKGLEIIGIWHIQLTTIKPSPEDYKAIEKAMRKLGVRRFVLGTGYISKNDEKWFQKINFETCWIEKKVYPL